MTVQRQLRRSFGVLTTAVLLLVVLFGGTAAYILLRVQPDLRDAVLAARYLHTAHEGMIDEETGVRGFLLSDTGASAAFLQPYYSGRASATRAARRRPPRSGRQGITSNTTRATWPDCSTLSKRPPSGDKSGRSLRFSTVT